MLCFYLRELGQSNPRHLFPPEIQFTSAVYSLYFVRKQRQVTDGRWKAGRSVERVTTAMAGLWTVSMAKLSAKQN